MFVAFMLPGQLSFDCSYRGFLLGTNIATCGSHIPWD